MRIDVFTLVPHAYAWLTEQRPVASVLGGELELRLFNYRDSTPLRAGHFGATLQAVLTTREEYGKSNLQLQTFGTN